MATTGGNIPVINKLTGMERRINDIGNKFDALSSKMKTFSERGGSIVGTLDSIGKGLTGLNASIIGLSFDFLIKGIQQVYELKERWARATGQMTKALGALTPNFKAASREIVKMAGTLRGLTDDFAGSIQMMTEFGMGLEQVNKKTLAYSKNWLVLARGFNLGAQGATTLQKAFRGLGMEFGEIDVTMVQMTEDAKLLEANSQAVAASLAESGDMIARFGKEGVKSLVRGAVFLSKFNITLKDTAGLMETFDKFDSATEAAAKLNIVFGTTISSMDVMFGGTQAERVEKMRQALLSQGKTWERMGQFEKNVLSQTLSLGQDKLEFLLDEKNAHISLAQFTADAEKKQVKEQEAQRKMNYQLRATVEVLFAWGIAMDKITGALGEMLRPLLEELGLLKSVNGESRSFSKEMGGIVNQIVKLMKVLAKDERWVGMMKSLAKHMRAAMDWFLNLKASDVAKFFNTVIEKVQKFVKYSLIISGAWAIFKVGGMVWNFFGGIAKTMKNMVGYASNISSNMSTGTAPMSHAYEYERQNRAGMDPMTMAYGGSSRGGLTKFGKFVKGAGIGLGGAAAGAGIGAVTGGGTMGGMIGGAVGGLAAAIPGIGPLLAPITSAIGGFLGKKLGSLFGGSLSSFEKELKKAKDAIKDVEFRRSNVQKKQEIADFKNMIFDSERRRKDEKIDNAMLKIKKKQFGVNGQDIELIKQRLSQARALGVDTEKADSVMKKVYGEGGTMVATNSQIKTLNDMLTLANIAVDESRITFERVNEQLKQDFLSAGEMEEKLAALKTKEAEVELENWKQYRKDTWEQMKGTSISDIKSAYNTLKFYQGISKSQITKEQNERIDHARKIKKWYERKETEAQLELNLQKRIREQSEASLKIEKQRVAFDLRSLLIKKAREEGEDGILNKMYKKVGKVGGYATNTEAEKVFASMLASGRIDPSKYGFTQAESSSMFETFASGGIASGPTRSLIGEAGPEAVIPLAQAVKPGSPANKLVRKMANYAGRKGSGGQTTVTTTANVYLNGAKVGKALMEQAIREAR